MRKCIKCNINIVDRSEMCPLCHSALDWEEDLEAADQAEAEGNGRQDQSDTTAMTDDTAPLSAMESEQEDDSITMYPNAIPAMRKMRMIIRISIFAAVCVELIAILVNVLTYNGFKWSLISGVTLAYAGFTLIYSAQRQRSTQKKIVVQLVFGLLLVWAMDYLLGYYGWSLTFGMPILILCVDVAIAVLMIINRKRWQNYLMEEICMLLISIVCNILVWKSHSEFWLLSVISVFVNAVLLAGTIVIGDQKAESELQRRFHM